MWFCHGFLQGRGIVAARRLLGLAIRALSEGGNVSVGTLGMASLAIVTSCFIVIANASPARVGTLSSSLRSGLTRGNGGTGDIRNGTAN